MTINSADIRDVAILIFPGVELLDFAGPAEVFIVSNHGKSFRVLTVAESVDPIQTMGGITITPEYSINNAPRPDVLVVPGGSTGNVGDGVVDWIRRTSQEAEITMSVCTGAFLLAKAGLLDGIEATTHSWMLEGLAKAAPSCSVVSNLRFSDSGRVLTTAGVTAGIDATLHVVSRLLGEEAARWTAQEWMEYDWTPGAG